MLIKLVNFLLFLYICTVLGRKSQQFQNPEKAHPVLGLKLMLELIIFHIDTITHNRCLQIEILAVLLPTKADDCPAIVWMCAW